MKFTVPESYSVVHRGQVIHSKGGVIETNDKALIESLSSNPKATQERQQERQQAKPKAKGEGA